MHAARSKAWAWVLAAGASHPMPSGAMGEDGERHCHTCRRSWGPCRKGPPRSGARPMQGYDRDAECRPVADSDVLLQPRPGNPLLAGAQRRRQSAAVVHWASHSLWLAVISGALASPLHDRQCSPGLHKPSPSPAVAQAWCQPHGSIPAGRPIHLYSPSRVIASGQVGTAALDWGLCFGRAPRRLWEALRAIQLHHNRVLAAYAPRSMAAPLPQLCRRRLQADAPPTLCCRQQLRACPSPAGGSHVGGSNAAAGPSHG